MAERVLEDADTGIYVVPSSATVPVRAEVGGRLVALNVADGTERWRTGNFRVGFVWPPEPSGDRIYVAGSGAGFFALRP